MKTSEGMTLIELVVVVVIVGILASVAIPSYLNTKERALDREAIVALKLIRAANKQYYAKAESFYPPSTASPVTSISAINGNLSLDLAETNWDYLVEYISGTNFRANATRIGATRRFNISAATPEPSCSASCL